MDRVQLYGHILGQCSRTKYDHAYVWIPKNGSSSIRHHFGMDASDNFYDFDVVHYWAFIRDPYTRWKSGIIEWLYRRENGFHPDDFENISQAVEYVGDNIWQIEFDEHTTPQYKFLDFEGPTTYVSLDIANSLAMTDLGGGKYQVVKGNQSQGNLRKTMLMKDLDKMITPELIKAIDDFYERDYDLISQAYHDTKTWMDKTGNWVHNKDGYT